MRRARFGRSTGPFRRGGSSAAAAPKPSSRPRPATPTRRLPGPHPAALELFRPWRRRSSPPNRWLEAFNPRVPLYRDTYNEYLVFVVSAIGSVAGTQVPLYLVMALTDLWNVWVFVAACVVFELFVIFFIARPQMKPNERVMWAALWAGATAVLALAFYYLVAEPTL